MQKKIREQDAKSCKSLLSNKSVRKRFRVGTISLVDEKNRSYAIPGGRGSEVALSCHLISVTSIERSVLT